jgi:hypothetical protein
MRHGIQPMNAFEGLLSVAAVNLVPLGTQRIIYRFMLLPLLFTTRYTLVNSHGYCHGRTLIVVRWVGPWGTEYI